MPDEPGFAVEPEDLLAFGMIPESVGRLPVAASLTALTEDELVQILTEPKNAMVKQYAKLFSIEGVGLNVTREAVRALAQQALAKGTGARALRSLLERLMLDVMYDIPSRGDVESVTINRAAVLGKRPPPAQEAGRRRGVVRWNATSGALSLRRDVSPYVILRM